MEDYEIARTIDPLLARSESQVVGLPVPAGAASETCSRYGTTFSLDAVSAQAAASPTSSCERCRQRV
jgi:hypothetical protein